MFEFLVGAYIVLWTIVTCGVIRHLVKTRGNERWFWLQICCVPFLLFFYTPVIAWQALRGK